MILQRDKKAFAAARTRYIAAQEREQAYRMDVLYEKYRNRFPNRSWMIGGEIKRLEAFTQAENRAIEAMFVVLDRIGSRDWRVGAPCDWIMRELTIEDATTQAALSVIPPLAFGQTSRMMAQFCEPVS